MTPEEKIRLKAGIREILELHFGSIENISYDDKKFIINAVRDSFNVKSRPSLKSAPRWEIDMG